MVSVARIRLDSLKCMRLFKGIICDDISEFESHMPSHAVGSLGASSRLQKYVRMTHLLTGLPENFCHLVRHDARDEVTRTARLSEAGLPSAHVELRVTREKPLRVAWNGRCIAGAAHQRPVEQTLQRLSRYRDGAGEQRRRDSDTKSFLGMLFIA
jgi:hypothetical protein